MSHQYIWLTDIHLNFLDNEQLDRFINRLSRKKVDGILIAGDIGEANSIKNYLEILSNRLSFPIYFVLGNHDFYRGSVEFVRSEVLKFLSTRPTLQWLTNSNIISLSTETALIGHDSWADCQFGDYWKSNVQLNDFTLIGDFIGRTKTECLETMKSLADEAARHFKKALPEALQEHQKVIIVTHVPPFKESALYRGKISNPDWLPFFTCKAVGDVLLSVMSKYPNKEALVLCGHTHGSAFFQPLPNLKVITGAAVYGKPTIHKAIEID